MENFNYFTPTKIVFGRQTENQVAQLVEEHGAKKVLIHYGGGSVERSGLLEKVKNALAEKEISFVLLGGVVPNPHLSLVRKGIALCKEEKVDFILAVGGGSVMDSAKAIAYGACDDGDVWDFYLGKRKAYACLPIGAIVTLAATGSEMSKSSVITDESTLLKRSYGTDMARPRFAILNPELTMSVPAYQTASGCVDVLLHTMERYFNQSSNLDLTDSIAEGLLRTVMKHGKILLDQPDNYQSRAEILWAGSLSHNGLTGCGTDGGDWACHKIEHEISGLFDVTHGAGLAAIWASWARYVYTYRKDRFLQFAQQVMGVNQSNCQNDEACIQEGIDRMERYFKSLHMPISLEELIGRQATDEEIQVMAEKCSEGTKHKTGIVRILDTEDIILILKDANRNKTL